MNNSISYSNFVDLILKNKDNYEPYGVDSASSNLVGLRGNKPEFNSRKESPYTDEIDKWFGE